MTASVETPTPDSDPLHLKAHVERLLSVPNGTSAGPSGTTQHDPYAVPLKTEHAYTARKIRVITIGAGFSGLLIAHKIQHRFPELDGYVSHTIFEARGDVGGTWLVNTYPGVQCDVPAHAYAFPFDPNPNWSKFYASGTEIQDYIHRTVRKWNLDRDLQLNTRVVEMAWQAEKGEWRVEVENTLTGEKRVEYAEIVLSAQGVLVYVSRILLYFYQGSELMKPDIPCGPKFLASTSLRATSRTRETGTTSLITRGNASLSLVMDRQAFRSHLRWQICPEQRL